MLLLLQSLVLCDLIFSQKQLQRREGETEGERSSRRSRGHSLQQLLVLVQLLPNGRYSSKRGEMGIHPKTAGSHIFLGVAAALPVGLLMEIPGRQQQEFLVLLLLLSLAMMRFSCCCSPPSAADAAAAAAVGALRLRIAHWQWRLLLISFAEDPLSEQCN